MDYIHATRNNRLYSNYDDVQRDTIPFLNVETSTQIIDKIDVSPSAVNLPLNGRQQFTATCKNNNNVVSCPELNWNIFTFPFNRYNNLDQNGLYTAPGSPVIQSPVIVAFWNNADGTVIMGLANVRIIGAKYDMFSFITNYDDGAYANHALGSSQPIQSEGVEIVPGIVGKGIKIDSNDKLRYEAMSNIDLGEGVIEFFIKPEWDGNIPEYHTFFSIYKKNSDGGEFKIGKEGNKLTSWTLNYKIVGKVSYDISNWKKDEWHYVAVSWGSEGRKLYVDGELVDSNSYTGGLTYSIPGPSNFWIGANARNDGIEQANAIIDEFAIRKVQSTPEEVSQWSIWQWVTNLFR